MTLLARQAPQKELMSLRKEVSKIILTSLNTVVGIDVKADSAKARPLFLREYVRL
jgi:hypothetical protein